MPISYNKIDVHIDLAALQDNWRLLNRRGGHAMAVVKSDAYGHGLVETSRALAEVGATTFAVGTVEEAVQLRTSGAIDQDMRVIALLGPVDGWEYEALGEHGIIPFIGNFEQLGRMSQAARGSAPPLPLCLKFDTGMARLGFTREDIPTLLDALKNASGLAPVMLASHLATGDDPAKADYAAEQAEEFQTVQSDLAAAGLQLEATLANSGAILAHPDLHFDTQRAGIALYGMNPFAKTAWEEKGQGLKQAMQVSAPVLEVHTLKKGRSVSYGQTYTAEKDMRVAIIGAGYADLWSRGLSNAGAVCIHGVRAPIVGRVCMQMTAVDLTPLDEAGAGRAQVGDRAWLLGGEGRGFITADELAAWWKTITYEVFCLLGMNRKQFTK